MTVTITNPKAPAETPSERTFKLECAFVYDEEQYGNGYYVSIHGDDFYPKYLDLRYNRDFNPDNKPALLELWARNYWTGTDGAWAIKHMEISHVTE